MQWLLSAILSPVFHAGSNVLDNNLINRLFKNVWTLTFYSSLFNTLFLPLVCFIERPNMLPLNLIPAALAIGVIEVVYLFPYFKALQHEETSVVIALFSLGKVFIPILAYLFVGETLRPVQYLGFFVIILGSAVVSLHGQKELKLNAALLYMFACSFLLSLEAVLYKYLFGNVSWSTGFVWPAVFSFLFAFFFLLIPAVRADIQRHDRTFIRHLPTFAANEFLTFAGSAAATFAVSLGSVTLTQGIGSFQPFFVLMYALLLGRFAPGIFKERVDRKSFAWKSLWFFVMIAGAVLAL